MTGLVKFRYVLFLNIFLLFTLLFFSSLGGSKILTPAKKHVEKKKTEIKKETETVEFKRTQNIANNDFILDWQFIGLFDNQNGQGFDKDYIGETSTTFKDTYKTKGGNASWVTFKSNNTRHINDGKINLNSFYNNPMHVVMYATTTIDSPKAMYAYFYMGSDDGIKAWLNGDLVHSNKVFRGVKIDDDRVRVKLKKGKNVILVKVIQRDGGFGFCFRIGDEKGKPL